MYGGGSMLLDYSVQCSYSSLQYNMLTVTTLSALHATRLQYITVQFA